MLRHVRDVQEDMMRRKRGVKLGGLKVEILVGLLLAEAVFLDMGEEAMWFTDLVARRDGMSYHPSGYAVDLRLPVKADVHRLRDRLKDELGPEFDIIVESDHLHIEFDVRKQGA